MGTDHSAGLPEEVVEPMPPIAVCFSKEQMLVLAAKIQSSGIGTKQQRHALIQLLYDRLEIVDG